MMRVLFGVVTLLVVLAVVGMLVSRQLKAYNSRAPGAAATEQASPGRLSSQGAPDAAAPAPATVREQSRQTQQRAKEDVTRALEQGAAARKGEAEK